MSSVDFIFGYFPWRTFLLDAILVLSYNACMWSYLLLGAIQGIMEWLPISSQGMVALFGRFMSLGVNEIDIALFLHLGTMMAVLVYFRKDWKSIILLRNPRLLRFLIIATIISLVIGFPLYHLVRGLIIGPALLVVTGVGLLGTAWLHRTKERKGWNFNKVTYLTGVLQGLSIIPGFSRSGATIFGLSLGKLSPPEILKISYLMSLPIVLISSFYLVLQEPLLIWAGWPALITSFIFGIVSLRLLLKLSQQISFVFWALLFAIFCFVGAFISYLSL